MSARIPTKKPSDIVVEGALKQNRLAIVDAFRTWLKTADLSELEQELKHLGVAG